MDPLPCCLRWTVFYVPGKCMEPLWTLSGFHKTEKMIRCDVLLYIQRIYSPWSEEQMDRELDWEQMVLGNTVSYLFVVTHKATG